jgi:glucose-6-phosphate isomerase
MTITIDRLDAAAVGTLIALYERAVGLYASLVNINAYHQPGVEAGKKAAGAILALQGKILGHLRKSNRTTDAESLAVAIGASEQTEAVFMILRHLAANPDHHVIMESADPLWKSRFGSQS